ncbi:MAG: DUF7064 domain-containing protein [Solirubrobacteraceae bacterium]
MAVSALIRGPGEISAEWLGEVLDRPDLELLGCEQIGTGQMSQSHRVTFAEPGGTPETLVVKLASEDAGSRATGVGMGAYFREVAFYRELAERLGGPLPGCRLAEYDRDEGSFTLVLEDAGSAQGDQIAGCSVEQARLALQALAQLHAPVMGDLALGTAEFLNQPSPLDQTLLSGLLPTFLERYGERIAPEHAELCRRFVASIDGWAADRRPPLGLVHGDYRLDNLLFSPRGCTVLDWQTVSWGPVMLDASYFIGGCLTVEDRRASERELVGLYHDTLSELGATGLGWEQCWQEYRRLSFHGMLMTIAASVIVERTERGDEMFMTWLARNAQQAIDLRAAELLPEPGAGRTAPLRPDPQEEGRHQPGPEALWNESWYFDAVSGDGALGLYVRLGRLPNQDVCLYTACVCGPGRPSVMLVDAAAPLPGAEDPAQAIESKGPPALSARQLCEEPLQRFRVQVRGQAQAFDDEAAPLRGESGRPLALELDLVWETDGIPYAWRQSSRYEIPCRVTGTVLVGEERIELAGPGQRDHSWGARDWWAVDWMWSAVHLEDGSHLHAVGVPQMPGYGVGYVQRGGELSEVESVRMSEQIAPDGLIEQARIELAPQAVSLVLEPLGFGALRLQAPDGRLSLFPRAMCRVRSGDGRSGLGWVEWNRVQRG